MLVKTLLATLIALYSVSASAQRIIKGAVFDASDNRPLAGAKITIRSSSTLSVADDNGEFRIRIADLDSLLIVSQMGYQTKHAQIPANADSITVKLDRSEQLLQEVVISTGYGELPRERATGSFEWIGEALLNRNTAPDIVSRLEGITGSLQFDRRAVGTGSAYGEDFRNLRIRGLSSIYAETAPLIVLDNFPYEGDINNINPNDIESITVLKDAAAASIWGARAGNGVIVITSKKGRHAVRPRLSFNSTFTQTDRPDLFYSPEFLDTRDFIGVERELFSRGYYQENDWTLLSPVIEMLIAAREDPSTANEVESQINEWAANDIRRDAECMLYRTGVLQQHSLNVGGGTEQLRYYFSGGFDRDLSTTIGNSNNRITLNSNTTYQLADRLEATLGMAYTSRMDVRNGIGLYDLNPVGKSIVYPYARLREPDGTPAPIFRNYRQAYIAQSEEMGLLDWESRPLDERALSDSRNRISETRINIGLSYKLPLGFQLGAKYQYQLQNSAGENLRGSPSYDVRDLVNRFTQPDGEQVFPYGDILTLNDAKQIAHYGRAQANYAGTFGLDHRLDMLAGMEVRNVGIRSKYNQWYGYDHNVLTFDQQLNYVQRYPTRPRGSNARIPMPTSSLEAKSDRYVSYFANLAYAYKKRYIFSGSARRDASNLVGVKTNQRGVPLWSLGASWEISAEPFYDNQRYPYLRLRTTYGVNGNVDRSVAAFTTIQYYGGTLSLNGQPYARVANPGNPELRWERIGVFNMGLDIGQAGNRINGRIEFYQKNGNDLLGNTAIDPTLSWDAQRLGRMRINYADMRTQGLDLEVNTAIEMGRVNWRTALLFSYVSNKVIDYKGEDALAITSYTGGTNNIPPQEGKSLDGMYSFPWHGLDPQTGDPLVLLHGETSKEYATWFRQLQLEDLVYHGLSVPPVFGSLRNTLNWRGWSISANVLWKGDYYFRRSALSYDALFSSWRGHREFSDRWQVEGDELKTNVPSMPASPVSNRDAAYIHSQVTIEKGDHIRLQDLNVSYSLNKQQVSWLPFSNIRVYLYASNLGTIWQANKLGLDPDYPNANFRPARSLAFGIQANL